MRRISVNLEDDVFDAIDKYQLEQLKRNKKLSINKIINSWLSEYIAVIIKEIAWMKKKKQ